MRIIVGITGASGAIYAVKLIEVLGKDHEVFLIVSEIGEKILEMETGYTVDKLSKFVKSIWRNNDLFAPPASGSFKFDALIICPCSLTTLSKIAYGIADNLITRTATVALKEGRKIILVPRETPLDAVHLEAMTKLAKIGVIILPACPAFWHKPKSLNDIVNYIVGKILDQLGIEHKLFPRWGKLL